MNKRFVDLLDESSLACALLQGLSIAAAVVFGLVAVAAGFAALFVDVLWIWGFLAGGLLCGLAAGFSFWLCDEYY